MSTNEERLHRIEQLGHHLLAAAKALETEQWEVLRVVALKVSRETRMLQLLEKQEAQENGND